MKQFSLIFPLLLMSLFISGIEAQPTERPVITPQNAAQVELLSVMGADRIFDIDWSADGQHIAVFSQNQLAVYETDHLDSTPHILKNDPCGISQYPCRGTVDFSEDSQMLVVGSGYYIDTYDVPQSTHLATYFSEIDTSTLLYSQTHQLLFFGGGPANSRLIGIRDFDASKAYADIQPLGFWDNPDLRGVEFYDGIPNSVSLSPDGQLLTIVNTELFSQPDLHMDTYKPNISTLLFDIRAIMNSIDEDDSRSVLIRPTDAEFQTILGGKSDRMTRAIFSPDGSLLAAAGLDGQLQIWSMPDGEWVSTLVGHYSAAWDVAFSPDGSHLVSAGGDGTIRFWDIESGQEDLTISGLNVAITALAFNPEGTQLVAGGWDGSLWMFDTSTGEMIESRPNIATNTWVIAFNADGTRFALGNDDNEVILFDVIDEAPFVKVNQIFRNDEGPVYALAFHPEGTKLASGGSDGIIYEWDFISGETTETDAPYIHNAVYGLAYSPDGTKLGCAIQSGAGLVEHLRCSTRGNDNGTLPYSVAFSPDGSLFAYGDTIITTTGGSPVTLQAWRYGSDSYSSARSKLTFSADGSVLLNGATEHASYVWRLNDLAGAVTPLAGGLLALSPDGSLIAGRNLMIVDTTTGEPLLSLGPSPDDLSREEFSRNLSRDAVFSPDGRLIVTANVDGTIRFWGIPAN